MAEHQVRNLDIEQVNRYLKYFDGYEPQNDEEKQEKNASQLMTRADLRKRAKELMKDVARGKISLEVENRDGSINKEATKARCEALDQLVTEGMGENEGLAKAEWRRSIGTADKGDNLVIKTKDIVDNVSKGGRSPYQVKKQRKEKLTKFWNATKNVAKMVATGIATGVTLVATGIAGGVKWGYDKIKEQIKKHQEKKQAKFNASLQTKEGAAKAAKGDLSKLNATQIAAIWNNVKEGRWGEMAESDERYAMSNQAEKMMQQIKEGKIEITKDNATEIAQWYNISAEVQDRINHNNVEAKNGRNDEIAKKLEELGMMGLYKREGVTAETAENNVKTNDSPENVMPPAENVNVQANNNLNQQGQQVEVNAPEAKVNAQNVKDVTDEADKVINGEREQNDSAEGQNNPVTETPVADVDATLEQKEESLAARAGYKFAENHGSVSAGTEKDIQKHIARMKSHGLNENDVNRLHAKMTGTSKDKKTHNYGDISEERYNKYLETWDEQFPELAQAFRKIDKKNTAAKHPEEHTNGAKSNAGIIIQNANNKRDMGA